MKKTLLTFLLGTSLVIGANQLKGQEKFMHAFKNNDDAFMYDFKNNDEDDFNEQIFGYHYEEIEQEGYATKKDARLNKKTKYTIESRTITVGYFDKNDDNFHEHIRVVNKRMRLVVGGIIVEDFYINKETGLINYKFREYMLSSDEWDNKFNSKESCLKFSDIFKKECFDDILPLEKIYKIDLTGEDLYNMDMDKRVKNLINSYKDKNRLEDMLKYEMYLGEKKFEED